AREDREPDRAPARGADATDRFRAVARGRGGHRVRRRAAGRFRPQRSMTQPHFMSSVLRGIRVVEQGTFITGPCAGMMLADLGADVIKIERPEGDPYRSYQNGQYSPHFQAYNRNKRSLALDLGSATDREVFERLIRKADVYIQNFRPGTADRLGAGVERLH